MIPIPLLVFHFERDFGKAKSLVNLITKKNIIPIPLLVFHFERDFGNAKSLVNLITK